MTGMRSKKALCFSILFVLFVGALPMVSGRLLYIGPTEEGEVGIIESAAVDSDSPDTPTSSLGAASRGKYTFVKIDLSKLPPIDEIYIVKAYLGFGFGSWSGRGEWGYASVATHYCEDDSWSKATLTWNTKPEYQQEFTDTWGFSYFYYGSPNLGFYIEDDVEESLMAGDTVLTEVVTWGSGTGSTGLSSPSIRIEYARRPVYTVETEAVCDDPEIDVEDVGLAKVEVSGKSLLSWEEGKERVADFCAAPGTYSLAFLGKCKFAGWETSGGVSVSSPGSPLSQITVDSDGSLTMKCSLDWILYGDEERSSPSRDGIALNASQRYAEKHTAIVSGYLRILRLYVVKDPMPFELHILGLTEDPEKSPPTEMADPIKVTPTGEGWLELDLTSQEIKVEKDSAFYISITWLYDGKPSFDETLGATGDVYTVTTTNWGRSYDDILTQLIVSRTLEEPVEFITTVTTQITTTPKPTTTTKETTITTRETTITRTTSPSPTTEATPTTTFETTVAPTKPTYTPVSTTAAATTVTVTQPAGELPDWVYGLIGLVFIVFVLVAIGLAVRWVYRRVRGRPSGPSPLVVGSPPPPAI